MKFCGAFAWSLSDGMGQHKGILAAESNRGEFLLCVYFVFYGWHVYWHDY